MNKLMKACRMPAIAYVILLSLPCLALAQNASDYLPAKFGSTWRYLRFTVDAAQNPIAATKTIETDSLAGTKLVGGITALLFRNRANPLRDSTIVNVHGDSISYFNGGFPKEGIKLVADSLGLGFLPQVPGWYTYVKLNTPPAVNKADTLFRHDSTITVDGTDFDLTLVITRTMKPVSDVTVPAGTFNAAVPFEINLVLNWWVFTPLGRRAQPFLKLHNVIYVAANNWVIKETQDSTWFPLTATDNDSIPKFNIPGYVRLLDKLTPTSVAQDPGGLGQPRTQADGTPAGFQLSQNFPNPFNGTTTIAFDIEKQSAVTIRIVDILGRTMETMTAGPLPPGRHQMQWNSSAAPSGVYFYEVETESSRAVKRMILQK